MNTFYTNAAIDYVQTATKTFLNTYVKDESLRQPALDVVSAQTTYAKSMTDAAEQFTKAIASYDYKNLFNFAK
jgi:hypothetical protein